MRNPYSKHSIHLLEYLSEKEYTEVKALQDICLDKDRTNLKLELEYKLQIASSQITETDRINELLYYIGDTLVAYLGISCFGGNIGEINGLTHPSWRRKGLFKKLLALAVAECHGRGFSKLLLLSDGSSSSGIGFIRSAGGVYDFSEYRMKHDKATSHSDICPITLRAASEKDWKEIAKQNAIYFNDGIESATTIPEEDREDEGEASYMEDAPNTNTYMIELSNKVIGKIKVDYYDDSAFICGFGIMPEYRGKGYGKAALRETLRIIQNKNILDIQLDVVCTNSNALLLYKACGFEEISTMNYYRYDIDMK